jgi:hypothetical protein
VLEQRRTDDRRREPRFEVVGDLWATLEVRPSLRLLNLSQGGALVESLQPLSVDTQYQARLSAGDATSVVDVIVRHVREAGAGGYQIGLEFADVTGDTGLYLLGLLRETERGET